SVEAMRKILVSSIAVLVGCAGGRVNTPTSSTSPSSSAAPSAPASAPTAPSAPSTPASSAPAPAPAPAPSSGATPASPPIFPATNPWNPDISGYRVPPNSDAFITSIGFSTGLHPDFGTVYNGAPNGIPFVVVNSSQPLVPMTFSYASESDPGP